MTRNLSRTLCVAGLLALLAVVLLAATAQPAAAAKSSDANPTVVLVHGAWADSSSWSGIVRRLQHRGYTVRVPPTPLRGLASDSASLASYLAAITGPIVLVGHSYGGAVITNAATEDTDVKALVYIDAFAPAQGETVVQLATAQPGSAIGGDPASPGAPGIGTVSNTAGSRARAAGESNTGERLMTAAVFAEFEARELSTSRGTLHAMVGGSGPPLLLLHGYPQTDLMWHAAAPPLAEPDPRAEPGRRIGLGT